MIFYALIKALIYVWFYKLFFILISAHKHSHITIKPKENQRGVWTENAE